MLVSDTIKQSYHMIPSTRSCNCEDVPYFNDDYKRDCIYVIYIYKRFLPNC